MTTRPDRKGNLITALHYGFGKHILLLDLTQITAFTKVRFAGSIHLIALDYVFLWHCNCFAPVSLTNCVEQNFLTSQDEC